jgi:L-rhamnose mutarotase
MVIKKEEHKDYWDNLVSVFKEMGYTIQNENTTDFMFVKCNDADVPTLVEMAKENS